MLHKDEKRRVKEVHEEQFKTVKSVWLEISHPNNNVKVKFSQCLTKYHAKKIYSMFN
jgi:hypothetical protein